MLFSISGEQFAISGEAGGLPVLYNPVRHGAMSILGGLSCYFFGIALWIIRK
jgi:hypothetical protein